MTETYRRGDQVEWNWGGHTASGQVRDVHTDDITRTIKGSEVKRTASEDCPAYTIEQPDGDVVLKSHSEIRRKS